jgi:hypothetical protein
VDPLSDVREMAMRKLVMLGLVSLTVLGLQVPSAMAGGNRLEFRSAESDPRTSRSRWDIFVVGESVVARVGYLSGFFGLGDGPFHLWIERGDAVEAGMPIPSSAIRVGTFEMTADGSGGHAGFVLPALPSGLHTLTVCDDPCTETGFGEYVQGWLTVVQTPAEGRLLSRVRDLRESSRARTHRMRTDLRRAERTEQGLRDALGTVRDDLAATRAQVDRLISLAASDRPASHPDRDLIDGGAGAWIASGLVIAALIIRRRRGPRIVVPDTPADLLSPARPHDRSREETRAVPSESILENLDA